MSLFREGAFPAPVSMRRVLAFIFGCNSLPVFVIGALRASMPAVWGGVALLSATCLLLFFTTWGDLSDAAVKLKNIQ